MADNFDNYGMKVRATVDMPSVGDIDKQIRKLEKSISKLQISGKLDDASLKALSHQLDTLKATVTTANFSPTALTELTNQVNRALQNVRIDNIDIGNVNNQAQQVGRQIGQQISQGVAQGINNNEQILNSFRLSLQNMNSSSINMDTTQIERVVQDVENLGLRLESVKETMTTTRGRRGDRNVLSVAITGIDELGQAVSLTRQYDAATTEVIRNVNAVSTATQKANTQLEDLATKQIKRQQDLRNQVSQIYSSGRDQNHDRSITNSNNLRSLDDEYENITNRIDAMRRSSKTAFAEQDAEISGLITNLKNLIAQYRNEENVRTTIKPDKLAEGISKAQSRWKSLETQINNANLNFEDESLQRLNEQITNIRNNISTIETGGVLNKAEVERLHTTLTNAKHELDALVQMKTSNSSLEAIRLQADTLKNKLDEFGKKNVGFATWTREVDNATISVETLKSELDGVRTASDLRVATARVNEFESAFKAVNATASKTNDLTEKVNRIQLLRDEGKFTKQISDVTADYNRLSIVTDELKADFKEINRLGEVLNTSADADELRQSYEQFNTTLQKVKNSISVMDNQGLMFADQKKIDSLADSVLKFRDNNTKMSKDLRRQFTGIYDSLINDTNLTEKEVAKLSQQFSNLKLKVRDAGQLGQSFGDKMLNAFKKFSEWGFATGIVTSITSKLREAVTELKEIDTLLTEISKADDSLSKTELVNIADDGFDTASKYGKKVTDYLAGVQEMSRAGYDNAEAMAELSTAVQGAGDMTSELANSYIVATDNAYALNGSIEELTRVMDGANNITNNNAVNMTELAEGMSVVGAQAASSQMSVEETTAAIATLVAVTQNGGPEMGNAFKGILMNLRQVTGEVEDGGDAIDESSLTKYEKACEELGVSLTTVKDGVVSLKEPMQILKELSVEYQKLDESDAKRANLLSAVGGKYRANALNAILENYELYEEILQDYAEGEGTMAREAEKTTNSLEGSLNRLSNTWTDTVENIVSSEFLTNAVNFFNTLLTGVNNLTDALGELGTIGLGGGIFAGIKVFQNVDYLKMPVCPHHI